MDWRSQFPQETMERRKDFRQPWDYATSDNIVINVLDLLGLLVLKRLRKVVLPGIESRLECLSTGMPRPLSATVTVSPSLCSCSVISVAKPFMASSTELSMISQIKDGDRPYRLRRCTCRVACGLGLALRGRRCCCRCIFLRLVFSFWLQSPWCVIG